jgi:predicted nucleic acid-binding protein
LLSADLVVIDQRDGRIAAQTCGLTVAGQGAGRGPRGSAP